jgi:hypothetical protein
VLTHSSEALLAKEVCGLLASLEAATYPRIWQRYCLCLGGKGFIEYNQEGEELFEKGFYLGQKKENMHS